MKDSSDALATEESKEPQGWLEWLGITNPSPDIGIGEDTEETQG